MCVCMCAILICDSTSYYFSFSFVACLLVFVTSFENLTFESNCIANGFFPPSLVKIVMDRDHFFIYEGFELV